MGYDLAYFVHYIQIKNLRKGINAMTRRQKLFIAKMSKINKSNKQYYIMEINAAIIKLYQNVKWSTREILEVEKYLLHASIDSQTTIIKQGD